MNAEQLMTRNVAACRPLETLNEAARLMWERDCGCIPVVDENQKVLGVITDRDICMGALFHGTSLKDIPIGTIMSADAIACGPDCQIELAEALMEQNQIRRLPVVNGEGHLLGILSLNDIAVGYKRDQRNISARELANTIAAVSTHRCGALEANA